MKVSVCEEEVKTESKGKWNTEMVITVPEKNNKSEKGIEIDGRYNICGGRDNLFS